MDWVEGVVFAGCAAAAGWLIYYSDPVFTRRVLRRARRTPIATAADEETEVKVVGELRPAEGGALKAPVSGRPCVYYELLVRWGYYPIVRPGFPRTKEARDRGSVACELVDNTGVVNVDLDGAQVATRVSATKGKGQWHQIPPACAALATWRQARWPLAPRVHWVERILPVGAEVALYGRPVAESSAQGSPGGYVAPSRRLVFGGTERRPLLVSDDPATHR